MQLDWQTVVVVLIEVGAVIYLVRKLVGPTVPKVSRRPDVKVEALLRKKR